MDLEHLKKARALLRKGRPGYVHKGTFVSLCANVLDWNASTGFTKEEVWRELDFILSDLWGMLTICNHLDWMRQQAEQDDQVWAKWSYYASGDIEYWHVQLRSLLDYVAQLIRELADRKHQVPDSFRKLYEFAAQGGPKQDQFDKFLCRVGDDWVALLQQATWFPLILNVRDQVVHRGAHAMVFWPPSEGILFQVVEGRPTRNLLNLSALLRNDKNVVYFERYVAHIMSHVLVFLEQMAPIAYRRLGIEPRLNAMNCHFGFATLMNWIDATIGAADGGLHEAGTAAVEMRAAPRLDPRDLIDPDGGHAGLDVGPDD